MTCISPMSVKNKIGTRVTIPCGKCIPCMQKKRSEWSFRIKEELKVSSSAFFITLTYNEDNIPKINDVHVLSKIDVQLFLKRLRQFYGISGIKYYLVGEYGSEGHRPHYHLLIFNLPYKEKDKLKEEIEELWGKGFAHVGNVESASIHYVTGYIVNKAQEIEFKTREFAMISKGIGSSYVDKMRVYHKSIDRSFITWENGTVQSMPRYLKEKLYNKGQIKVIREKCIKESNKKEIKEMNMFQDLGRNYFINELETKRFKNRVKKQKDRLL